MSSGEAGLRAALRMMHMRLEALQARAEDAEADVRILKAERAELRSCLKEAVAIMRKARDTGFPRQYWSVGHGDTLRRANRLLR